MNTISKESFNLDGFYNLFADGKNYSDLKNKLENSNIKQASYKTFNELNFRDLSQSVSSLQRETKDFKQFCENYNYDKQNPNKYKLSIFLKTTLAVGVIAGGIIVGAASVILLPVVGVGVALVSGILTWMISSGLNFYFCSSSENPADELRSEGAAYMGILGGPFITPFIPLYQYLNQDKHFQESSDNLKTNQDLFYTKFKKFSEDFNSVYEEIKNLLDTEYSTLNSKENKNSDDLILLAETRKMQEYLGNIYNLTKDISPTHS